MPKKIILKGHVQGVFCRKYCSVYAKQMKINGSATNLPDDTVQLILMTDDLKLVKEYIDKYCRLNLFDKKYYIFQALGKIWNLMRFRHEILNWNS